jgi:hypothetical protein
MSCPCQNDINSLNSALDKISSRLNLVSGSSIQNYLNFTKIQSTQSNISNIQNLYISNLFTIGNNLITINNDTKKIAFNGNISNDLFTSYGNANISGNIIIQNEANIYSLKSYSFLSRYTNTTLPLYGIPQRDFITSNSFTTYITPNQSYEGVCWSPELGIFAAVSTNGSGSAVMTSFDGITWTLQTTPIDNGWNHICWSPELGLFVAVAWSGSNDRVMTSPDGMNWTLRSTPTNNNFWGVCWAPELGLFCAVSATGSTNRAMISSDGINWTSSTTPDKSWTSVCWSSELKMFCAVASPTTSNNNLVMTSYDGINWTSQVTPANNNWESVCWSPQLGLFCAVGGTGTNNRIMTSSDGINWTLRTNPVDNYWVSVTWAPEIGLFIAVSVSGSSNRIMTSPDGITWTSRTSPIDNTWTSISWAPQLGIFCAVSTDATNLSMVSQSMYSYSSNVYGNINNINTFFNIRSNNSSNILTYNGGNIGIHNAYPLNGNLVIDGNVSVGWGYSNTLYSTSNQVPLVTMNGRSLWKITGQYFGGTAAILYFDSDYGNTFIISSGISPYTHVTEYLLGDGAANIGLISYGNTIINNGNVTLGNAITLNGNILIGSNIYNGNSRVLINSTSNIISFFQNNSIQKVEVSGNANIYGNVFINGQSNISSLYSEHFYNPYYGTNTLKVGTPQRNYITNNEWLRRSTPNNNAYWGIDWSPQLGLFAAVSIDGVGNRVMTSLDGINWTARTSASDINWVSIHWVSDLSLFIAVGAGIMTSPDGINWTLRTSPIASIRDFAWSPKLKLLVAVASSGTDRCITSSDGITWSIVSIFSNTWYRIVWSQEVGIFVAISDGTVSVTNRIAYSYDGTNWNYVDAPANYSYRGLVYASNLRLFISSSLSNVGSEIMTSPDGITWTIRSTPTVSGLQNITYSPELNLVLGLSGANAIYSSDGINWSSYAHGYSSNATWRNICWCGELGVFVGVNSDTILSSQVLTSSSMWSYPLNIYLNSYNASSNLNVDDKTLFVNSGNNRVGILTSTPAFELEVNGSAGKTGGGTWAAPSDMRIKKNIENANLDICIQNIESLKLKYFKWSNITGYNQDIHSLGWIAQDVKNIYPNSILLAEKYGFNDFHNIDVDLIWKCMYGSVKKLINDKEDLEKRAQEIQTFLQNL